MHTRRVLIASALAVMAVAAVLPSARATEIVFALRSTGHSGGEPTLGQLPDGTILLQAYGDTLASTDEGAHWTVAHTPPTTTYGTADPMLVVDPVTGRVVASELLVASQVVSLRDETTGAWTDVVDHAATGDHQQIGSGPWRADSALPHDYSRAFYTCGNYVATTYCSVSRDGGLTWGPNVPIVAGVDPTATAGVYAKGVCGGISGKPHVAPDGTVYVPKEHCGRPWISVSKDEGLTWTSNQVGGAGTQTRPIGAANDPIVTTDASGTLYYAWTGADWAHWVSRSADQGATWSAPQKVGAPGVRSTTFPLIIAGRAGAVATAYLGSENVLPGDDEDSWQGPGDASYIAIWNLYVAFSFDADAAEPTWQTMKLTTNADPVWRGCIGKHGTACGGPIGRQGMADFTGIALTRDGRVMIAYTDGCLACRFDVESEADIAHLAIQTGGPTIA